MKFLSVLIISCVLAMSPESFADNLKKPNVSGQFYPANPAHLSAQIGQYLDAAPAAPKGQSYEILIAPHAGYVYSGPTAAYGYKAVSRLQPKTVVVIAPSHHLGFPGFSVWPDGAFRTPLGDIPVDSEFANDLLEKNGRFVFEPQAFEKGQEHSLEVQLPFLQKVFKGFKIVPVIAGQPDYALTETLADSLHELIGSRRDVLVVISTDMSHFYDAKTAEAMDKNAIQAIKDLNARRVWDQCRRRGGEFEMCGSVPVVTALLLAQKRNLTPEVLHYTHSGKVIGDNRRVVGYFTAVFGKNEAGEAAELPKEQSAVDGIKPLSVDQKKKLMHIARTTIDTFVKTGKIPEFDLTDERLKEIEGAFVTVNAKGRLRGCIGNIIGRQALYLTVRDMAVAAVSQDHRFEPVTPEELKDIEIDISVLSKPRVIKDPNLIEMGVHGVIVSRGPFHQGVFLPQVATDTGWTLEQFMSQLCSQKAGLPPDAWKDPRTKIEVFTADVFEEHDLE